MTAYHLSRLCRHWVVSVAFSPDGKILASGSRDNTVRLWDAHSYNQISTLYEHRYWKNYEGIIHMQSNPNLTWTLRHYIKTVLFNCVLLIISIRMHCRVMLKSRIVQIKGHARRLFGHRDTRLREPGRHDTRLEYRCDCANGWIRDEEFDFFQGQTRFYTSDGWRSG